jgi:hypothetical protein
VTSATEPMEARLGSKVKASWTPEMVVPLLAREMETMAVSPARATTEATLTVLI